MVDTHTHTTWLLLFPLHNNCLGVPGHGRPSYGHLLRSLAPSNSVNWVAGQTPRHRKPQWKLNKKKVLRFQVAATAHCPQVFLWVTTFHIRNGWINPVYMQLSLNPGGDGCRSNASGPENDFSGHGPQPAIGLSWCAWGLDFFAWGCFILQSWEVTS